MDTFMGAPGEQDWQVTTGSVLDFETPFDLDQNYMGLNEDAGPCGFVQNQNTAFEQAYLTNTEGDFSMDQTYFGDQKMDLESGYANALDLQQAPTTYQSGYANPLDLQQAPATFQPTFLEYDYPAPAPALGPLTQEVYLPAQAIFTDFVPPQTPIFAPGPDQAALLASYYTQAAEYYKLRAGEYEANDPPDESSTRANVSTHRQQGSPPALTADVHATHDETLSETASLVEHQILPDGPRPMQSTRKRADTVDSIPTHLKKHEPRRIAEARQKRGSRACFLVHPGSLEVETSQRPISRRNNRGGNPAKRKPKIDDKEYEEGEDTEQKVKPPPSRATSKRQAKPTRAVSEPSESESDEESDDDIVMVDDDDEYLPEPPSRSRKSRR